MRLGALRQDGILGRWCELAQRRATRENDLGVPVARTALGIHEEILLANVIQVRTLNPDGLLGGTDALVDEDNGLATHLVGIEVIFASPDGAVAAVFGGIGRFVVVDDITFAIRVEEERRVDAMHLGHGNRFAPTLARVLRLEDDVARAGHDGDDEIERLVLFTIFNIGREDTAGDVRTIGKERLRRTVDDVAAEVPIDQVLTVPNRNTRPIDERAIGHIEIIPLAADGGVGIRARDDGIQEMSLGIERLVVARIVSAIGERLKLRCCVLIRLIHTSCHSQKQWKQMKVSHRPILFELCKCIYFYFYGQCLVSNPKNNVSFLKAFAPSAIKIETKRGYSDVKRGQSSM